MLRLIHAQTVQGALLVDDIDDGLPNKEVHRLGSQADPKSYMRDGYANKPKQSCYVPFSHPIAGGSAVAGFINLNQTQRVLFSAGNGKIAKLQKAGLISVVSLTTANLAAPVVTASVHGTPMTITGTTLSSVAPDQTSVTFAIGTGGTTPVPATLSQAAIITAGGSVSATTISIPAAAFTTAPIALNTVTVTANEQTSNTFIMT